MARARLCRIGSRPWLVAALVAAGAGWSGQGLAAERRPPRPPSLGPIFADGFETEECELWSSSSNPPSAPDVDLDQFGDLNEPTVHCARPDGHVLDVSDCDDLDPDVHPGAIELCNGVDDDCDSDTPDGSADPGVGLVCDGGDSDLCDEGATVCSGGAIECSDATGSTLDLCNGEDDDCDPASPDGSEDPLIGLLCDGDDSDLCQEGSNVCPAGVLLCSDETGSTLDLCNGLDDDCDKASPDGSEDPLVGLVCDGGDGDLCTEGTTFCAGGGSLDCSDQTGTTVELCAGDGQDEDCDGLVDEGFPMDGGATCPPFYAGSISGDTGAQVATDSYHNERFVRVRVTEDNDGLVYLSARFELWSPPGTDFDLYLYCQSCGGTVIQSSTIHSTSGHWDVVNIRNDDDWGSEDSFDAVVEIRHFAHTMCGFWQLQVTGNQFAGSNNCDP